MKLELLKFLVQPVVVEREDGKIIGERIADPVALYTEQQVREYFEAFTAQLEQLNDGE